MYNNETWCIDCEDYYAPSSNGDVCEKIDCGPCQINTKEGNCELCPEFFCADEETRTMCVTEPDCHLWGKITGPDGKCKICPEFKRPNIDGRSCGPEPCDYFSILLATGYCDICPVYYRPDDSKRTCI
jgi:hypothetical protein